MRRSNVKYKYKGQLHTVKEISEMTGLKRSTVHSRIRLYKDRITDDVFDKELSMGISIMGKTIIKEPKPKTPRKSRAEPKTVTEILTPKTKTVMTISNNSRAKPKGISYKVISESGFIYYPSLRSELSILDQITEFRIGEGWWLVEEYKLNDVQKSDVIIEMSDGVMKKVRDPITVRTPTITWTITFSDNTTEVLNVDQFTSRYIQPPPTKWKWHPIEDEFDNHYSSDFYNKWRMIRIERNEAVRKRTKTKKVPDLPILPDNPTKLEKRKYQRQVREYNKANAKANAKAKAEELL